MEPGMEFKLVLEPETEAAFASAEKKVTSYRKWIENQLDRFNGYYDRIASLKRGVDSSAR